MVSHPIIELHVSPKKIQSTRIFSESILTKKNPQLVVTDRKEHFEGYNG
jgi:hypothetical protein